MFTQYTNFLDAEERSAFRSPSMVAMELPLVPQCLAHNANSRKKILWKKFQFSKHMYHILCLVFSVLTVQKVTKSSY